jgi:hypothetical protein
MLEKQQQLYQRICDYELDDPGHEFGFLAHLMGANGWSRSFALRAIEEYRKFVFLALVADHQVTPSDQVDQVWHLHLLCSDAYWNDFCPRVLGRPLHHHPAKGGQAERDRFHEQYRATIRSYRQHFGEPPLDLWPPLDVRFGRDLQIWRHHQQCRRDSSHGKSRNQGSLSAPCGFVRFRRADRSRLSCPMWLHSQRPLRGPPYGYGHCL